MLIKQFFSMFTNDIIERLFKYVSSGYNLEEGLEAVVKDYEDECILEPENKEERELIKQSIRLELISYMSEETILANLS